MTPTDPSAQAHSEQLLRSVQKDVVPDAGAADRIRRRVMNRISTPQLLGIARDAIQPDVRASQRVWNRIAAGLAPSPLWSGVRDALRPSREARISVWQRVSERLHPAPVLSVLISRPLKLVAAFTILLFVVQASPQLFLAPPSVAESAVTVMPTSGEVSVLIGGLWQPLKGELNLRSATMLQTARGEATIVLHDDAVFRMGPHTTLALNDFADRPSAPESSPSVFLQGGKLWVLSLVPRHLEGISIGTAQGRVMVHEGSVSIEDAESTEVRIWHRSAVLTRRGQQLTLVAGERTVLSRVSRLSIARIASETYDDLWVSHNLAMDAAHQREIALMQQERRAASAGILPTSTLYPAKRLAEAVDVLFTIDPEAKARKQITHANTRLNEAAALLTTGSGTAIAADTALREYREAMVAVASGAMVSPALESLVEQELIATAFADTAAALPMDSAYALKQTVRETIAALPDSMEKPDVETAQLLDELSAVKRRADEGEVQAAKVELEKLRPGLAINDAAASLSPEMRKEVEATLSTVVAAVEDHTEPMHVAEQPVSRATSRTLNEQSRSRRPTVQPVQPLTEEELAIMVTQIRNRVMEGYHTPEGRQIQLEREFRRLQGHPDQGRILRKLSQMLPQDGLSTVVRSEIRQVAEENGTEPLGGGCTGSGC